MQAWKWWNDVFCGMLHVDCWCHICDHGLTLLSTHFHHCWPKRYNTIVIAAALIQIKCRSSFSNRLQYRRLSIEKREESANGTSQLSIGVLHIWPPTHRRTSRTLTQTYFHRLILSALWKLNMYLLLLVTTYFHMIEYKMAPTLPDEWETRQ